MIRKLIILFILLALWGFMFIFTARAESPTLTPEQLYDSQLEQWLDRLQFDESRTNPLIVILDTNNKYSYGCLQFQMGTWNHYSKLYNVDAEIMDCKAQRSVAKSMIKDNWSNWRHWYTSVTTKTAGYPPKFELQKAP